MENEILKVLMKNSDVSTIFMAVGMVYLGKQVANMAANIAEIHKDLAIMFEKHNNNEIKTDKNSLDILVLRERHHDLVNNHIIKIESNSLKIDELEKKVNN